MRGVEVSLAYDSALRLSFEVNGSLLMRQTHHWAALVFLTASRPFPAAEWPAATGVALDLPAARARARLTALRAWSNTIGRESLLAERLLPRRRT